MSRRPPRVGSFPYDNPTIKTAFICRKIEEGGDDYDEIAIIQHNCDNGATWWFRAVTLEEESDEECGEPHRRRLLSDVLSPNVSAFANAQPDETTYNTIKWEGIPNEFCQTYHVPDPFLHTPYLRQGALMVDGKLIVPSLFTRLGDHDIRM